MPTNAFGQPVGESLPEWVPPPPARPTELVGQHCTLQALAPHHRPGLYDALGAAAPEELWTYMKDGPFPDLAGFEDYLDRLPAIGQYPMAVLAPDPVGLLCLLREDRTNGTVEIGSITHGAALQRTSAATEAFYLVARHVFDLGYRRLEWKCDALNEASRRAAHRFGFTSEGVHRQGVVYKGRSRDTAWFSLLDSEWPRVRAEHERWLSTENFDDAGRQRSPLRVGGSG